MFNVDAIVWGSWYQMTCRTEDDASRAADSAQPRHSTMTPPNDQDGPRLVVTETYDRTSPEPMSLRIIRLVAIASDRTPTDLSPLGRVIDADAIDAIFDSQAVEGQGTSIELSFNYEGYRIEITANGTVKLFTDEA